MSRILLAAFIFSFYCWGSVATAQTTELSLTGFAGVVLPSGDFGDDDSQGDGGASTGLGVGVDYVRPMPDLLEGFSALGTASLNINPADDFAGGDDADVGYWLNLPLLVGGRYTAEVSPTMQAFGQAQIGLNVARSPSVEVSSGSFSQEIESGMATTLGLSFGVGAVLNDRFDVSLRYVTAGEPEFEVDVTSGDQSGEADFETAIAFLQLIVGISL